MSRLKEYIQYKKNKKFILNQLNGKVNPWVCFHLD